MSTIPKEIMDKIDEKRKSYYSQLPDNLYAMAHNTGFDRGATFGYQLATDGREELEKEIADLYQELKLDYFVKETLYKEITALQSSLKEKEGVIIQRKRESVFFNVKIDEYSEQIKSQSKQIEELKKEIERLKGNQGYEHQYHD